MENPSGNIRQYEEKPRASPPLQYKKRRIYCFQTSCHTQPQYACQAGTHQSDFKITQTIINHQIPHQNPHNNPPPESAQQSTTKIHQQNLHKNLLSILKIHHQKPTTKKFTAKKSTAKKLKKNVRATSRTKSLKKTSRENTPGGTRIATRRARGRGQTGWTARRAIPRQS